jgi:hypothetical protein
MSDGSSGYGQRKKTSLEHVCQHAGLSKEVSGRVTIIDENAHFHPNLSLSIPWQI